MHYSTQPTFTEVESAASESDQTSNADVGFTMVDSNETVTVVSKFSSTQHQDEDFYYEDMDISANADYDSVNIHFRESVWGFNIICSTSTKTSSCSLARRGDIKVKALVAAKAAKIRQEKQENERNWKKEAFRM
ncbi:unnamed protein product [Lactuca saligna]|uniref:Uncharacterized protein n=1 Tax=Lactuca saligna TaxID=75948 RepID=A0AA36A4R3_LACSI|nr:unnamed protein product [Lactuca saligna]